MTNKTKNTTAKGKTTNRNKKAAPKKDLPKKLTPYELFRIRDGATMEDLGYAPVKSEKKVDAVIVEEAKAEYKLAEVKTTPKPEAVVADVKAPADPEPAKSPEEPEAPESSAAPSTEYDELPASLQTVEAETDEEEEVEEETPVLATKPKIIPTPKQNTVVEDILSWYLDKKRKQHYEFAGYAGVGKSTVIDIILVRLPVKHTQVLLCAPTGTAALNMREKTGMPASTIHSLFYERTWDEKLKRYVWEPTAKNLVGIKLVIIDEGSMVTTTLRDDVLAMCRKSGVKVLVVGDRGQLPPVGSPDAFFANPNALLEDIMRQAAGNKIIDLSFRIRQATKEGRPFLINGENRNISENLFIRQQSDVRIEHIAKVIQNKGILIAGTNKTRMNYNHAIRQELGYTSTHLMDGEYVVIKKNAMDADDGVPVSNGMRGTVSDVVFNEETQLVSFTFHPENFEGERRISVNEDLLFGRITDKEFYFRNQKRKTSGLPQFEKGLVSTLGYCITAHASQGGQWNTVYLINESEAFNRYDKDNPSVPGYAAKNRWLYTAVTRAQKNLVIMVSAFYSRKELENVAAHQ